MEKKNEKIEKETREDYEKEPSSAEALVGKKEILKKIELDEEEKKMRGELEKEMEKIKLSPEVKVQAQKQSEEMKKQSVKGKIQHLLDLAQTQSVAYAIEVAQKMNDPYLLDLFHDTLAKEGLFKKFLEK